MHWCVQWSRFLAYPEPAVYTLKLTYSERLCYNFISLETQPARTGYEASPVAFFFAGCVSTIERTDVSDQFVTILVALIAAIGGGVDGAFITASFNRKKTDAEAETSVAQAAMTVMKQTLENTVTPLNRRIDELEASEAALKTQVEGQAVTLEELNAKFTRLQLAFVINESFIKSQGYEPPIQLMNLESLSTNDLRDIASSMRNIEQRRRLETSQ